MSNNINSFDLVKLKDALVSMQPAKPDIELAFEAIYPQIKASLERGVTKKAIMMKLAGFGMKLHPAKFKALCDKEVNRQINQHVQTTNSSTGGRK